MAKGIFLTVSIVLSFSSFAYGAFEDKESGARPLGMGGAFVAVSDDPTAVFQNPAGLPQLASPQIVLFYTKLFGLNDLPYYAMSYGHPLGEVGAVGTAWQGFGWEFYREDAFFLSYGYRWENDIALGGSAKALWLRFRDPNYSADVLGIGLDVGAHYTPVEALRIGLFGRNLNQPKLIDRLPLEVRGGVALKPLLLSGESPSANWTVALDYNYLHVQEGYLWDYRNAFNLGSELWIVEWLALRLGWQSNPIRYTAGAGVKCGDISLDYALLSHSQLPATHFASFTYTFDFQGDEAKSGSSERGD
ncbi:MAG: hypothetical protein ACUVXI_11095 [bacterium]